MNFVGMSSEMCHQKHFNRRKAIYGTSSMYKLLALDNTSHYFYNIITRICTVVS